MRNFHVLIIISFFIGTIALAKDDSRGDIPSKKHYFSDPTTEKQCEVIACQEIVFSSKGLSWCLGFNESVSIVPTESDYKSPESHTDYTDIKVDFSDGGQISFLQSSSGQIGEEQRKYNTVYIDGYWWDKYYESYKLYLHCPL